MKNLINRFGAFSFFKILLALVYISFWTLTLAMIFFIYYEDASIFDALNLPFEKILISFLAYIFTFSTGFYMLGVHEAKNDNRYDKQILENKKKREAFGLNGHTINWWDDNKKKVYYSNPTKVEIIDRVFCTCGAPFENAEEMHTGPFYWFFIMPFAGQVFWTFAFAAIAIPVLIYQWIF